MIQRLLRRSTLGGLLQLETERERESERERQSLPPPLFLFIFEREENKKIERGGRERGKEREKKGM